MSTLPQDIKPMLSKNLKSSLPTDRKPNLATQVETETEARTKIDVITHEHPEPAISFRLFPEGAGLVYYDSYETLQYLELGEREIAIFQTVVDHAKSRSTLCISDESSAFLQDETGKINQITRQQLLSKLGTQLIEQQEQAERHRDTVERQRREGGAEHEIREAEEELAATCKEILETEHLISTARKGKRSVQGRESAATI